MSKVRHVLGISGGKDSAALAIYIKNNYPDIHDKVEYYTSDTGRELDETYQLIERLENYLGKKILKLESVSEDTLSKEQTNPFDIYLKSFGGYLPSTNARWCTKKLKLYPFEKFVGTDPVISYVGIRGDEDREGYISKKSTIQSIFPFRRNIWSEDVINKVLSNSNIEFYKNEINKLDTSIDLVRFREIIETPISNSYNRDTKLKLILEVGTKEFNRLVFSYLKTTDYPLSFEENYSLIENEDVLVLEDIYKTLKDSGIGIPAYYNPIEFEINGKIGKYSRSRSGCFFCFYQQKIEWVWLYEQHNELFIKAMEYEKEGYTWMQDEPLTELIKPERISRIKEDYIKKMENKKSRIPGGYFKDNPELDDDEQAGCASCFI
jgi:3'-phosphoadenosine 5'-phosphosulfate sulfotransferase (PAPS reductase)/FAD synthetase